MPFALENVRITDLTWLLAGAGGPRLVAAMGAEDIRIEWRGRFDFLRFSALTIPLGEERERILGGQPSLAMPSESPNRGGTFAENNPGKRGISLNLQHPKGKELFKELVRVSDVVVECFTAQTMDRLGLGYEELRKVNPTIIYIQQPGFGKKGEYVKYVSTGPVAQAISGLTEQSGLPDPYPPAGWGYSYMDWSGAYYCAMAILTSLYYRARTGEGQYMDCSQAEPAIYLTGTAILDSVANGRQFQRTGNRSPYVPAAPHGAYRCQGDDRWIAIAAHNDDEWQSLVEVLGSPAWARDESFAKLSSRVLHQDELDARMHEATLQWEAFELMERLQAAGVAAGVCQTAADRMFTDPQLKHRGFQIELPNPEVGVWPYKDFPVKFSETPASVGGTIGRGFPCYAQDNDYVYGDVLGIPAADRTAMADEDVI